MLTNPEFWYCCELFSLVKRENTRHASCASVCGVIRDAPVCRLISRMLLMQCYLIEQVHDIFQSHLTDSRESPEGSNKEKQIKDWLEMSTQLRIIHLTKRYSLRVCLSVTLAGCDNYFCPSQQTWMMELSFLLPFIINMTAIQYTLIEESFQWRFTL